MERPVGYCRALRLSLILLAVLPLALLLADWGWGP
jgi:hypothetical protein